MSRDQICCDCAGVDFEWMHRCDKHKTWHCRGCSCVYCEEEALDEYEEDSQLDLEDQLDRALDKSFPR